MNHTASAVRHPTIALLGNPNTGKTTLFNALAGLNQRVGNYPGVTVETKKGRLKHQGDIIDLIDLPGTYSLAARSPDEMVAVDLILGHQQGEPRPDVVLCIVDASNLERNLYLTTQVLEMGVPIVIALNMMDIATTRGVQIDVARLSKQLGVPVVPIQANKGQGLDVLKATLAEVAQGVRGPSSEAIGVPFPAAFEREIVSLGEQVGQDVPPFLVRRLLLDVGGYTEERITGRNGQTLRDQVASARQRLAAAGCPVPAVEARTRYGWIREKIAGCVERPRQRTESWSDRIDHVLIHRLWGTLFFLAVMFIVFQSIFTWAGPLMEGIDWGMSSLADWLRDLLPRGPLASLLIDGVVVGVGAVVIFLPQIMILFAFIAILEDCGYMARAAFLMDKLMSRAGLSGKSFIPLLSSVACAVPGIMATRVIENRRDRLATIMVAPLMSCSARLPVYILLIGAFFTVDYPFWIPGLIMFSMYLLGMVLAPLVAFALKRTFLRGETPVFVMEMPPYKWPSLGTVVRRVGESGWAFVRRAGTVILASMVIVWALLYFPYTDPQGQSFEEQVAAAEAKLAQLEESDASHADREKQQEQINELNEKWKEGSFLGQMGKAMEPVFRPLGWDWRLGMAALASFPAREVVVGTLGIIYKTGEPEDDDFAPLGKRLQDATWDDEPNREVFTPPVALGLMVFFALCAQCASTLAIIRRETRTWRWPIFTFVYMTALAYIGAFLVYQIGTFLSS